MQTHVVAGSLLGCLHATALYAYGCGLLALGVQRGGDARSPASYPSTAYAAAGGRVGLEIPFASRFAVNVAGDILAALNPMGIRSNLTTVWEAAPVAGAAQAGLVAFFELLSISNGIRPARPKYAAWTARPSRISIVRTTASPGARFTRLGSGVQR